MKSKKLLPDLFEDDDTYKVLEISLFFLREYFKHTEVYAEQLMVDFFNHYSNGFDEDAIHHYSSYRMSAIIHNLSHLNGNPNELQCWLISEGHNSPPPEVFAYFRENYFT